MMKIGDFIKKYPLLPVFLGLLVAVWIIYGIYDFICDRNSDANQQAFEDLSASVFSASDDSVSDSSVSDDSVSSNEPEEIIDEGPTEEELRAIAEAERKQRLADFYASCGDEEYYKYYYEQYPDFATLWEANEDVIAYLIIPDTKIDYPLLWSEDNGFYLDHNFDKKKGHTGCLYLEVYNDIFMQDPIAIIYGHDMLNDSMFGTLNKYLDGKYRKDHKYFFIYTPDETQVYEVAITSVVEDIHLLEVCEDFIEEDDGTEMFYGFRGDEPVKLYDAFVNKTISHSNTYITDEPFTEDDQLIVMSTCFRTGTRFIVVGKRIV